MVRLTASAAQQASQAPHNADPAAIARQAVTSAAREHAPGLLAAARPFGTGLAPLRALGPQRSDDHALRLLGRDKNAHTEGRRVMGSYMSGLELASTAS